jgi:hypothetical protein
VFPSCYWTVHPSWRCVVAARHLRLEASGELTWEPARSAESIRALSWPSGRLPVAAVARSAAIPRPDARERNSSSRRGSRRAGAARVRFRKTKTASHFHTYEQPAVLSVGLTREAVIAGAARDSPTD